jgi:predicted membrane protein
MNEIIKRTNKRSLLLMGVIVIAVGKLWLLQKMHIIDFPYWLFTWKTLVIVIGILIGVQSKFKGFTWIGFVITGAIFMLNDIPGIGKEMRHYTLPLLVIIGGLMLVLRALFKKHDDSGWSNSGFNSSDGSDEYLDITAIFGGSKRKIITKDFKGGEVVGIFGGSELDFTQADLTGNAVLDTTNIFGGLKIIVPSNWEVKSNITSIFGGVDDKRKTTVSTENPKVLVLTGFCMFGGVDIRSY